MFGFFGGFSTPSLILALKLFLNIQEKLKFCLRGKKPQQNKRFIFLFLRKRQVRKYFRISSRSPGKTKDLLQDLLEQVVSLKKQKEKKKRSISSILVSSFLSIQLHLKNCLCPAWSQAVTLHLTHQSLHLSRLLAPSR